MQLTIRRSENGQENYDRYLHLVSLQLVIQGWKPCGLHLKRSPFYRKRAKGVVIIVWERTQHG